jgi:energy-converting hydrogenase Eha subunit E
MKKDMKHNLTIGFIIGFFLGWWWTRDFTTIIKISAMIILGTIGTIIGYIKTIIQRKTKNTETDEIEIKLSKKLILTIITIITTIVIIAILLMVIR